MPVPYRAVLFDLDGTLIDSAVGIADAVNHTLRELGHTGEDEATVRAWIGDGARLLLHRALQHAGADVADGPDFEDAYARLMRHYGDSLPLQARAYPGACEALEALRQQDIRIALCTNKPERFIAPLLQALDWRERFDAIVGGDTLPQRKPDPEPLLHIAGKFGLIPAQCLMVGDSRTDAEAADAAGMPLALVDYGYRRDFDLDAAGACAIVGDLRQLPGLP
ncbi:phosphoglycolate phosphatase [Pseudoxanthomonas kalamensis DSM 18571]|uniref:phosphoglycolate phosphatase n=1 Tax=Pseudoxanthomonas kalamensis TaxID=289483 RepID=UPI001391336A|nr:phosphoglycolate phosphatase [Pseudoxanthomonas kalamensis]KAF1712699.1 phosphoglycolate phosphatase [Pseudoxanthomonas kalamensis DSM 18571]